jgi:hypothetical protein
MRTLFVVLGLVLIALLTATDAPGDRVLWPNTLRWEEGPPELHYRVAFGSLTAIRANGQVIRVNCELMRDDPSGPLMFNLKSGYSVYLGTWKPVDRNHVAVESRLVAREKLAVAKGKSSALPGPPIREEWQLHGGETLGTASSIETPGGDLVPAPVLQNPAEFEKIVRRYAKPSGSK